MPWAHLRRGAQRPHYYYYLLLNPAQYSKQLRALDQVEIFSVYLCSSCNQWLCPVLILCILTLYVSGLLPTSVLWTMVISIFWGKMPLLM